LIDANRLTNLLCFTLLEIHSLTILDVSLVTFGNNVAVGPNVSIFSVFHYTSNLSRAGFYQYALPVTIEDGCWIGGGTIILPGVTIGRGSTIGAGSVVTRDIPPNSVAVGSPARVTKTVQSLEEEKEDEGNPFRESFLKIPKPEEMSAILSKLT